jgi:hypothetical protein
MVFDTIGHTQARGLAGRKPSKSVLFRQWLAPKPPITGGKAYLWQRLHLRHAPWQMPYVIQEKWRQRTDEVSLRAVAGGFDDAPQSGRSSARFD